MTYQRVVAFKFRQDAPESAIRAHMAEFKRLKELIPQIRSYRGGRTIPPGAERPGAAPRYDSLHCLSFDSQKEIDEYFQHSAHGRFVEEFSSIWEDVLVINGEIE